MSNQSEQALNIELANQLAAMLPSFSKIEAEKTDVFLKSPGKKPDISIIGQGRAPVVIEAEFDPALNVEEEAQERFQTPRLKNQSRPIEAVIALRYPQELRQATNLKTAIAQTRLRYRVFYASEKPFPKDGWLEGFAYDLVDLIHLVAVPLNAFDKAAEDLSNSIDGAVSVLENSDAIYLTDQIFSLLGLADVLQTQRIPESKKRELKNTQTRRIACAILANALLFHERIAGIHKHIQPIDHICGKYIDNPKQSTLDAWENILTINYWPIFDAAQKIIHLLPAREASEILEILKNAAESIQKAGLLYEHDLTGHVFQRLIIDRKYLAAFYTLPESAALLARLAVAKIQNLDWKDAQAIGRLRIADFACGTGALLSAVYDQITTRHERTGGNPETLHPTMIEQVLYGCDVMPYAVHITASTLSGKQPTRTYDNSRLYTMPYGRQKDKTVQIGSLEFLDKPEQRVLFHTGDPAKRIGNAGEEASDLLKANVPDQSLDMVIMNPPFVRNVTREGDYEGTFAAAFAAFGASEEDQRDMAKRMALLKQGTCYHASAGMASAFIALADKKLKPGGILALVLPLSAANGSAWQKFRRLLAESYRNINIISIVAEKGTDMAFSSSTGIAECLIVARKLRQGESPSTHSQLVSLRRRPQTFPESALVGQQILAKTRCYNLEDGPIGGALLTVGKQSLGEVLAAPNEVGWGCVRVMDYSLPQTAYALKHSQLWLPGEANPLPLPMVALSAISEMGYYHLQIISDPPNEAPFYKTAPSNTSTYPALWNHNAKQETHIICQPDCQLRIKPGMQTQAHTIWKTAGHCHLTQDHTLTSQPLSVAITERKSIGGRAWPNVNFAKKSWDYAFALWGNCTLGLLSCWWHGNRQQPGRAIITVTTARTLPVLDFRALSEEQIKQAKDIFDQFKNKRFLPAYLADADETRRALDEAVLCDWLGFDKSIYKAVRQLASKWGAEPSVHGGKQR